MNRNNPIIRAAGTILPAVLILLTHINVYSQEVWSRLEAGNKEISFLIPPNYLVNEETLPFGEMVTVNGHFDETSFYASISDQSNAKANLSRVDIDPSRNPVVLDFELDGVPGRSITYSDRGYEHKIYIATKKGYYYFRVASGSKDDPAVGRFLNSILVRGKPMYQGQAASVETNGATRIEALKTSDAVKTALKAKRPKGNSTITFKPLSEFKPCEMDFSVRPAFVLSRLSASGIRPDMLRSNSGRIVFNLQLLATGRVGDIIVYSDLDKAVLRAFADSAKEIRFVPAVRSGTLVDQCETIALTFGVSTRMMMISSAN
jgi:hypothetical protein